MKFNRHLNITQNVNYLGQRKQLRDIFLGSSEGKLGKVITLQFLNRDKLYQRINYWWNGKLNDSEQEQFWQYIYEV